MQPDFERLFRPAGGSGFRRLPTIAAEGMVALGGERFAQVWHEGELVDGSDGRGDGYAGGL